MKRTVVSVFAFSSLFATVASADELQSKPDVQHADGYDAVPTVLFVPTETIPLVPSTECPVSQGGGDNSALGCVAGLDMAGDHMPPANVDDVIMGLTTALAPYNILVTSTRPPEFVPYQMLLPGDEVNDMSTSRTCAGAAIDCDGVQRNDIAFTNGGTMFCMDPDPVQAALIAFGYMSGLENNDNPMDPMYYQAATPFGPDFTMPSTMFVDVCSNLVETVDDMEMTNPLQCPASVNHEPYCEGADNQANSHLELVAYYGEGPWVEDTTPPTVDAMTIPEDGATVEGELDLSATVSDDSGLVFVRWTLQSDALIGLPGADATGRVCKGHNGVCAVSYEADPPYDQVEGGVYSTAPELASLPDGEYTITFEASDLSGNQLATPIMLTVTVSGNGGVDTTDGTATMTTDATATATDATATASDSDSDGESSSEESGNGSNQTGDEGGDEGGCSCSTDTEEQGYGGLAALFLGLVGFVASRRRE